MDYKFLKQFFTICILAVLFVALQLFAFTEPSSAPPGGNVSAPLNTGSQAQSKVGNLTLNGLAITGNPLQSPNNSFLIQTGNVGIGTTSPVYKLDVWGGSIRAAGGLIIETRTSDPVNPETGRIWLIAP